MTKRGVLLVAVRHGELVAHSPSAFRARRIKTGERMGARAPLPNHTLNKRGSRQIPNHVISVRSVSAEGATMPV
jgi:hypothetical protein